MNKIHISVGMLLLGLLCMCSIAAAGQDTLLIDDVTPYDGAIGPDSPLYGLKLAFEDIDESFTANETERVEKQMNHGKLRLSEVRRSLDLNRTDSAEIALNNYWLKMNLTNLTIARWSSNATGLLHAQEMILKHQFVLENLLARNPNNTGLQRAYNNSLRLEDKFAEKTAVKFQRLIDKNNRTILKAIRLEQKEHNRIGWPDVTGTTTTGTTQGADATVTGKGKDDKGNGKDKEVTPESTKEKGNQQKGPDDEKGNGKNK